MCSEFGLAIEFDPLPAHPKEAPMTVSRTDPPTRPSDAGPTSSPGPPAERRGPGAAIFLVLLPLLCCGGPVIFVALASVGAATLGTVGGVIGAVLVAVAAVLWVRRRRRGDAACCPPATTGTWRQ